MNPLLQRAILQPKPGNDDDLVHTLPKWLAVIPAGFRWAHRAIGRHKTAREFANRVEFCPLHAHLYADRPDSGSLKLQFLVINFSKRRREIDRAELQSLYVGVRGLNRRSDNLQAHRVLEARSWQWFQLDLELSSADIRSAVEGISGSTHNKNWQPSDVRVSITFVFDTPGGRARHHVEVSMPLASSNVLSPVLPP